MSDFCLRTCVSNIDVSRAEHSQTWVFARLMFLHHLAKTSPSLECGKSQRKAILGTGATYEQELSHAFKPRTLGAPDDSRQLSCLSWTPISIPRGQRYKPTMHVRRPGSEITLLASQMSSMWPVKIAPRRESGLPAVIHRRTQGARCVFDLLQCSKSSCLSLLDIDLLLQL